MAYLNSRNMADIICRTLNYVDSRLIDHGRKVSYILMELLKEHRCEEAAIRDLCLLAMIHDIGAYKTEEIDDLLQFESEDFWAHSIYGYLFLKKLSPLGRYASVVLYHHADLRQLDVESDTNLWLSQLLKLSDRIDIYSSKMPKENVLQQVNEQCGVRFPESCVELFERAEKKVGVLEHLEAGDYWEKVQDLLLDAPFTHSEIDMYLRMLVYAIDFRSQHTVIHTMTTMKISTEVAEIFQMDQETAEKIGYGALLHDLGKIGIPVEILEYPGRLSPAAMEIMRTHILLTGEILEDDIEEEIKHIAMGHHEKLDGSGYPKGVTGDQLSLEQRIVAVSDIVSALSGTRSYKDSFGKDETLMILRNLKEEGKLDPDVVDAIVVNYDTIMGKVKMSTEPILRIYRSINEEYAKLYSQLSMM